MKRFAAEPELLVLSVFAFFLSYALTTYRPAEAALLPLGLAAGWSVVAYLVFVKLSIVIPGAVLFLIVLPGVFSLTTLLGYIKLKKSLVHVEKALGTRIQINS